MSHTTTINGTPKVSFIHNTDWSGEATIVIHPSKEGGKTKEFDMPGEALLQLAFNIVADAAHQEVDDKFRKMEKKALGR